jgi:hypothetical protein
MDKAGILFPMVALAALTFSVLMLVGVRRFRAGFARRVHYDDFTLGESVRVPADLMLPNRNMMNLLEMQVLFYVACLAYYVAAQVDGVALALAWSYVALRIVHSGIHLSYNKVRHRLVAFAASNVALWAHLLQLLA